MQADGCTGHTTGDYETAWWWMVNLSRHIVEGHPPYSLACPVASEQVGAHRSTRGMRRHSPRPAPHARGLLCQKLDPDAHRWQEQGAPLQAYCNRAQAPPCRRASGRRVAGAATVLRSGCNVDWLRQAAAVAVDAAAKNEFHVERPSLAAGILVVPLRTPALLTLQLDTNAETLRCCQPPHTGLRD